MAEQTRDDLLWMCPSCLKALESGTAEKRCPGCGEAFRKIDGIWRFPPPERQGALKRFLREYQEIRRAEGRGSSDPEFYRALPFRPFSDLAEEPWKVRARSYQALIRSVIRPMEATSSKGLNILDLGAGNCWLSNRLADRGHRVVAVDWVTNREDGLGCHSHYPTRFIPVEADFDHLPFGAGQFQLAVYNASFHYSTGFERTLAETLRVLGPGGSVAIVDSPFYRSRESGTEMVRERERFFEKTYGFPSDALAGEGFVTFSRLDQLAEALNLDWRLVRPFYGWRWAFRPWKALLLGRREPAKFLLAVGRKRGEP